MSPEEKRMLEEVHQWMTQRKQQQISQPLDDPSRNIIGGLQDDGNGSSSLTQSINLSGNPETINVPAAYQDTRLILIGGIRYEIPYISTS